MPFRKTETLIELYKRKELLNFQNLLLAKLDDIKKGQEELKTALVEAIREQGREIKGEIKELSELTKQHHEQMKSQLQQISNSLEKDNSAINITNLTGTLINSAIGLWSYSSLLGAIKHSNNKIDKKNIFKGVCSVVATGVTFVNPVAGRITRITCTALPLVAGYFLS